MSPEGDGPSSLHGEFPRSAGTSRFLGIGTWEWDINSGKLWWSDEIYRIHGLEPGAIEPSLAMLIDRTLEEDRWIHDWSASDEALTAYSIYFRIRRCDGTIRTVRETGGPSPSSTPQSRRFIGTVMDVTQDFTEEARLLGAGNPSSGAWRWQIETDHFVPSAEALAILGVRLDGVVCGEEHRLLMHPDDRARAGDLYAQALRDNAPMRHRYRILRPTGEVRFIEEDVRPDGRGVLEGRIADVTERTRLERNLVQAQNIGKIGSWELDPRTGVLWWSDQTYRLLGLEPQSVVPSASLWLSFLHEDDRERARQALEAVHGQPNFTLQYRVCLPNGETRVMVEQGELSDGLEIGLLMDITEHHRAERNLNLAQQIARIGSWEWSVSSDDHWCSEQCWRILGLDPGTDRLTDQIWCDVTHPDDLQWTVAEVEAAIAAKRPYSLQYRLILPGGRERTVVEAGEPIFDDRYVGTLVDVTDRVRTERNLEKAQRIAQLGSWSVDVMTGERSWSDEMFRLIGVAPGTVPASVDAWITHVDPEDRERVLAVYCNSDRDKTGYAIQYRVNRPDHQTRYLMEQCEYADGSFSGYVMDITERQKSQRNLAKAQEIARIGSWEWDLADDQHYWSDECYRILGLDPTNVPSNGTWDLLVHPDDESWTSLEFEEAIAARRPYSYQYRIVRPDGQVRFVFERGEPLSSDKYAGTVMDVTERVKIETRLAESQRIAKLGTWEWNMATDERTWSDECYRLYAVSPSIRPIPRAVLLATIHPEDRPALEALFASVEADPRPYTYRCRIKRPDGVIRTIQVHGEPVIDFGPSNPVIFGTTHDITERESIETQLQHAQKMEAVGQLTGGIAHDFNNLLGAVLGNIDLLLDEIGDRPRAKALAERAASAAESGAQLVRRLLAFSRKQTLNAQVTDVNELIVSMLDLLRRSLGDKAQINTSLAAGAIYCVIDRAQTEGALLNLCINARDAMPDGGSAIVGTRVVTLDSHRRVGLPELRAGAYLELSVADSGVGMPRHVLERAFEPFFTTKAAGKGSGLGLSMVYGFVRQSEGHIEIDSEPGTGTTVRIYLPVHERTAGSAADLARPVPAPSTGRELVLVVEDNADLRGYAVNAVRSFGYRALAAPSAQSALKLLEHRPDIALLFTDIVFKDGPTGIQLADFARQTRPELPVLLTSGYLGDQTVQTRIRQHNTFTLAKPFRAADIGRKLAEIFGAQAPNHTLH